jgi:iron(III) transport system substrate-binding protein
MDVKRFRFIGHVGLIGFVSLLWLGAAWAAQEAGWQAAWRRIAAAAEKQGERLRAAEKADWRLEWQRTVEAAEREGQVTVYGPPGISYQNAIRAFESSYPKIKLLYVPGSGSDNAQRLLAERRAGKYLADVFVGGSGTLTLVLFRGNLLEPLPPALILPEVKDPSAWYGGKHTYADPKGQYVFMMQGNVNSGIAAYNTRLVNPAEIRSYWDLLNPKWKGKIVAYDPKARGHIQTVRAVYYNPKLGPEFIRRLLSEMEIALSRDQRLMLDWLAGGKYSLYVFATVNDVEEGRKKGLPVGVIYAPPEESHMSGGFGHVALVDRAPHPNAARVFLNWLLSKEGQLEWQRKSNNNSLRVDIPKDMLSDPRSVPQPGGQYLISSLPEYEDVEPVLKIVNAALSQSR